ncbi:hypothetical protein [Pedobacter namyangjuensis]|uniref:hypothetical protein n=1 Tax=Pedobacter namyangjuensis TaxID=600626 RepID=UPI0013B3EBFA|nr:hypothetical protein [Pedobacter namyangjuensis]
MNAFNPHYLPFECLQCGKELHGRRDKKYCNDTCRNAGNRKRVRSETWYEPLFVAQINTILKRNYKILKTEVIRHSGPTSVGRFYLVDKNFSFKYYTSILTTSSGTYHFIYDHGWRELDDGKIMVVMNPKQAEL